MNTLLVLTYGLFIYTGLVMASIPFGFFSSYKKARRTPLSPQALGRLLFFERLTEACIVIWLTKRLWQVQPNEPLLHVLGAYVFANAISYLTEVLLLQQSLKEFYWRMLFAFVVCLPAGVYLGSTLPAA